jgi:hypothetical protein
MRNIAPDSHTTRSPSSSSSRTPPSRRHRKIDPLELSDWLEARLDRVSERWLVDVHHRYDRSSTEVNGLLKEFLTGLVSFLPALLGPHRDQVESLWARAAELFGATAARRGLAAGEVIEEFQVLRESVIRLLYQDPPLEGRARLSLREILRLNRVIDRGVTHASVGHTDALFFSLFEGSGIPDTPPTEEMVAEVRAQLGELQGELREILGRVPGEGWGTS